MIKPLKREFPPHRDGGISSTINALVTQVNKLTEQLEAAQVSLPEPKAVFYVDDPTPGNPLGMVHELTPEHKIEALDVTGHDQVEEEVEFEEEVASDLNKISDGLGTPHVLEEEAEEIVVEEIAAAIEVEIKDEDVVVTESEPHPEPEIILATEALIPKKGKKDKKIKKKIKKDKK